MAAYRHRGAGLAGEFFLVTGSGKYFRNIAVDPEACLAIIELDDKGVNYRIRWGTGLKAAALTSELPTHLMNHEVKKAYKRQASCYLSRTYNQHQLH